MTPETFQLRPGYAFDHDGDTVILPRRAEYVSAQIGKGARYGSMDGSPVVWIETPAGAYAQSEHFMRPEETP
jgi:hypothetical protein